MCEMRTCKTCGETKPLAQFYATGIRSRSGKYSYRKSCIECVRALENMRKRRSRLLDDAVLTEGNAQWLCKEARRLREEAKKVEVEYFADLERRREAAKERRLREMERKREAKEAAEREELARKREELERVSEEVKREEILQTNRLMQPTYIAAAQKACPILHMGLWTDPKTVSKRVRLWTH